MSVPRPPLCPNADLLAAMPDEEFWAYVAARLQGASPGEPDELDEPPDLPTFTSIHDDPCPACGELGACSYDSEGRALIHALGPEE